MSLLYFPLLISLSLLALAHPTPQQPDDYLPIGSYNVPNSTGIFLDVNPDYYNPNLTAGAAAAPQSRAINSDWQYGCEIVAKNICRALDTNLLSASVDTGTDFLGGLDHAVWNYKAYTGCLAGAWLPTDVSGMTDEDCLHRYLYPMIVALLEDKGSNNRASVNVQVFPRKGSDGALWDYGKIGFILQL
ncbi:MAG: hypothetical protein LQ342_006519 [Letrouitia transgressa]|nr:MAG: hypothetical protein LQ342_006519 [Letrouitia transgressa]